MMKSVKGLRLSGLSSLLRSSRLYLTRNRARVFSSLDTLSRRSIFSTSSGLWNKAARMVMGLGEWSLAFCHTRFISATEPSGGKPEEGREQRGRRAYINSYRNKRRLNLSWLKSINGDYWDFTVITNFVNFFHWIISGAVWSQSSQWLKSQEAVNVLHLKVGNWSSSYSETY